MQRISQIIGSILLQAAPGLVFAIFPIIPWFPPAFKAQKGGCKWVSSQDAVSAAKTHLDKFAAGNAESLGKALFCMVGAALEADCETALQSACEAFIRDFREKEQAQEVPQSPAELMND